VTLTVDHVSRRFGGVVALADASLTLHTGEICGLIGPNGAGKSTLVNLISGFDRPSSGAIELDGKSITRRSPRFRARRGVARSFQNVSLVDGLTLRENVDLGLDALRLRRDGHAAHVIQRWLAEEGLDETLDRMPGEVSQGTAKWVDILRAAMIGTEVLLLDEPVAGLTADEASMVARLIKGLRDGETAILVIEHNLEFVRELCPQLTVLDLGRTIAQGSTAEVLELPEVLESYTGRPVGEEAPC
jgi:ABC-type branched-subunit amino acid transport system ATPase component